VERRALHGSVQPEPHLTQAVKDLRLVTIHAFRALRREKSWANKPPSARAGRPKRKLGEDPRRKGCKAGSTGAASQ
jgi:hypothetical protein